MTHLMTFDEICLKNGADKASQHPVKGHDYARHYEEAFYPFRNDQIKILEIGVGGGESIRSWLEYFSEAHVYGCDIVANTNPWNTHHKSSEANPEPRYDFLQGDQGSRVMWDCYLAFSGRDFTIIVDDGSHMAKDIQITFECLWSTVVPSGYYAIEDMNVGSTPGSVFLSSGFPNHLDWLKGLIEKMNSGTSDIASIYLSPELAIIRKKS